MASIASYKISVKGRSINLGAASKEECQAFIMHMLDALSDLNNVQSTHAKAVDKINTSVQKGPR